MSKLSMLILCLFLTCKIFSQIDTLSKKKNKYVFLTEEQAKRNIKELIAYDALKLISSEQENRIQNLNLIVQNLDEVVKTKDSIISIKNNIIKVQEEIIKLQKSVEFNIYGGVEFLNFEFSTPTFYTRAALDFDKWNVGVKLHGRPAEQFNLPHFYGTVNFEIKLFKWQ